MLTASVNLKRTRMATGERSSTNKPSSSKMSFSAPKKALLSKILAAAPSCLSSLKLKYNC